MRAVKGSSFSKLDRVVVLDVETTGLNPITDRIVSIAALKVSLIEIVRNGGANVGTFQALIDPERSIPSKASEINGIHTDDVTGQGNFGAHAIQLAEFIEDAPLIAHNCEFDAGFLANSFSRSGLGSVMSRPLFCTMKRACHHISLAGNYRTRVSLTDACDFFGISFARGKTHDALEDALAAMKLAATFVAIDRK